MVNLRTTLSFTPDLGLDVFSGWSALADLLRLQTRFRWTYAPGSDLFVVMQLDLDDDRWTDGFLSLLAKATYRFP